MDALGAGIMTHSGRRGHIIPVVLDDDGAHGVVGIPSTVGRMDLRDVYKGLAGCGEIAEDERVAIRNRCVLPRLEKLDTASPAAGAETTEAA